MKFRRSTARMALLVFLLAGAASVLAKSEMAADYGYTSSDQESYMTDELFFFFRPGLDFELISFEIPADLQPLVTFSLKDPGGVPLDIDGVLTPGPIDVRFMLTYIPEGSENKVNYHARRRDRGGVYTDLGGGVYSYKFATVLPSDYEVNSTHTLASVATRDFGDDEFDNLGLESRYYDNDVYNFVPSGAGEPMPRDIVSTTTCNRCHDPLGLHGGRYQEVQVCQSCHNPDLYNEEFELSYSLGPLVHRVHAGTEPQIGEIHYPAIINDCQVCHTGGTPTEEFPLVAKPAPAPSCDSSGHSMTELTWGDAGNIELRINAANGTLLRSGAGEGSLVTGKWVNDNMAFVLVDADSGDVIQSVTPHNTVFGCVGNPPGAAYGDAAALHTNWMTRPSRATCGACHVDIDFELGIGHPYMPNDDDCAYCHRATGSEYGFSVAGAHTVDYKSAQLGGVLVQIVDISNIGPGKRPVVTFSLGNKWGPLPPSYLGRLRFSLSGPNDDFSFYAQDDAIDALQADGANWKFQFETPLPSNAVGSYSVGVEGRINSWAINAGTPLEFEMRDQMQNFITPFAVTGTNIMSRREVVDDARCESCHANLSLHGGNRHNAGEYCQTCHYPSATDEEERQAGDTPESIDFRYMVHKIHRGVALENGYVVAGHNGSVNDFSDIHYVGDLRNCEACHVDDSYTLPLPDGLLPVTTPRAQFTPMLPATAACLSCHDGDSAASHALSNTSQLGEACATCHGRGKRYSVESVHAR